MTSLLRTPGAALLLLAAACGRREPGPHAKLPASPREPTAVSVLRIPRAGGNARLYRVPSLDSLDWHSTDEVPAVRQVVGGDPEQGVVFVLDRTNNLVAIDLDTRRVRTKLKDVRTGTIGPDGTVYTVATDRTVTQLVRQAPVRFRSKLQGDPRELHATIGGVLLARVEGGRRGLEILGSDRQPATTPIPDGAFTATTLGDMAAVAADTAVVLYSAGSKQPPRSIRVPGGARAAAFSPSGHLLYVVGETANVVVIDRFGREVLEQIELPGPARDLRADARGRWLLVRPAEGEFVWVIDVGTRHYVGAVPTEWGETLPVVAAPNTLLGRQGEDVVAFDLAGPRFPETGRVNDGAEDFWLPIAWHPPVSRDKTPVAVAAAPDTGAAADADTTGLEPGDSALAPPKIYLQVASSQNPAWAEDLAGKLRAAELPASVLAPKQPGDPHRVVLGPYPTREQAEEAGRGLGMPYFVLTIQGD